MASNLLHKFDSDGQICGYDVNLRDEKEFEKNQCTLCSKILREPVQNERGEVACQRCYTNAHKHDGLCPIDKEPSNGKVYRDKGREKDVLALLCHCTFVKFGCTWKGQLRDVEDHAANCTSKVVKCQFCHEEMGLISLSNHINSCPKLVSQGCLIKGCSYKPAANEDAHHLQKHFQENTIFHAHLQSAHNELIIQLSTQVTLQSQMIEERDKELQALRLQMGEIEATTRKSLMEMEVSVKRLSAEKDEKISELEDKMKRLEDEDKSRHNENSQESAEVSRLSEEVARMNKSFSDLDLRQKLQENTTYNSKLVWKIDNLESRLQQAVSGRVTALHSAPAYTDRYGYKFCARLYLNGDGLGKFTHVSLFFVLIKSEYDNRLSWPFSRKVTLRLINMNGRENIEESFAPDPLSTSFKKPVKAMNIATGCPRFISVDSFKNGGFVKDNCVFVEIEIGEIEQTSGKKSTKIESIEGTD